MLHGSFLSVSVYNLVNVYNESHALSEKAPNHFARSDFQPPLSDHTLQAGLDLHRLIPEFQQRKKPFTVPSTSIGRNRFEAAKGQVLAWIELAGSPYIDHICDKCAHIQLIDDGKGGAYCKLFL